MSGSSQAWRPSLPDRPGQAEVPAAGPASWYRGEAGGWAVPAGGSVVDSRGTLAGASLDVAVDRLAATLGRLGVGPGMVVAVLSVRDRDLVVALLAVLRSGGVYLPLDPELPQQRLAHMVADAGAGLVVTGRTLAGRAAHLGVAVLYLDEPDAVPSRAVPASSAVPPDCAYVMYTSGSTGSPKGVAVSYSNLWHFLHGMDRLLADHPPGRWLAVAGVGFDISLTELLWTVTRGHEVHVQPNALVELLESPLRASASERITHLQCTPTLLRALWTDPDVAAGVRGLDVLLVGGERFPVELLPDLLAPGPRPQIYNVYGPTEATVWVSGGEVVSTAHEVPIGTPFPGTALAIVDEHGRPVPAGRPGLLRIDGASVALGYLNQPELTARCFVTLRSAEGDVPAYHTGDTAVRSADGECVVLDRADRQVKVRGLRIEPAEIEAGLLRSDAVSFAAVVVPSDTGADPYLVAYVQLNSPTTEAELKRELREFLPEQMVPRRIVALGRLPLNPVGKLDWAQLRSLEYLHRNLAAAGRVGPSAARAGME